MDYYSSLDASQLDSETPTLFEIISANQLEALLSPSLRFVLVYYAQKHPGILLKLANRFDEINVLLRSAIELYFLNRWQGSFTENFYGLKRVSQTPLSSSKYAGSKIVQLVPSIVEERRRLSLVQKLVSVMEITGTAYFLEKLGYKYELLYSKFVTNQLNESDSLSKLENRTIRLQRLFVKLYPYFQTSWRLSNLAATIMYLSGLTKSPSLLTFLFNINFSRLTSYDYSRNEPVASVPSSQNKVNRTRPYTKFETTMHILLRYVSRPTGNAVKYALGTFFPLAIFTLKFLEWWNNSDFAQTLAKLQNCSLETIVPPPSVLGRLKEVHEKPKKIYKSGHVCPLCKDEISNPAIIETGYVFCYTCIYNFLRDSHTLVKEKGNVSNEVESDGESDNESEKSAEEDEKLDYDDEETNYTRKNSISEENPDSKGPEHSVQMPTDPNSSQKVFSSIDISRGGRCPVTGKKLLGCRWNELKGEFDIDGIRRLIF